MTSNGVVTLTLKGRDVDSAGHFSRCSDDSIPLREGLQPVEVNAERGAF